MKDKLNLNLIVQEMDNQSNEMSAFLNMETQEMIFISEDEFRYAEDEEPIGELPEWLQAQIKTLCLSEERKLNVAKYEVKLVEVID